MLLERAVQIEQLARSFNAADQGRGRVSAVLGEAGVGKTSLVEAFARDVAVRARVLRGACEDLSISEPLGPLRDLARGAGWSLPRDLQDVSSLDLFLEALRVFSNSEHATVVAVEDLHWADDATLDWIRFLGRRITKTRILLVLTARNDTADAQKRIRRVLADIPADALVRIEVPLLSLDAVAQLTRATPLDARTLHKATAGNAFFVSEAILSGGLETTPAGIQDSVLLRADQLGPDARAALDLVSIFPAQVEASLVSDLIGEEAAHPVRQCVDAGLLVEAGTSLRFRHEVARRVVERSLGHGHRKELHRQVLASLSARDDVPVANVVHHARAAEDFELLRAMAPAAAESASRIGAHREAASILAAALDSPGSETLPDRAHLLMRLAIELHLMGRIADAMGRLSEALRLFEAAGDHVGAGNGLRWMSRLSYFAGDRVAAERHGTAALVRLQGERDSPELAMAHSNLSQLAMLADDVAPALEHGRTAADLARRLDRPDILSHALNNMGAARQWTDEAAAWRDLAESLDLARRNDLQEHAARAYTNMACMLVHRRQHDQACHLLKEGIGYCMDRDLDTWRDYMRSWQAEVLLRIGHWDEAAVIAQQVLGNPEATPLARFPACVALARLRARRGDPAGDLFGEIEGYLVRGRELQRLAPYAVLQAERAWMTADGTDEAITLLQEALALMPNTSIYQDVPLWLSLLSDRDTQAARFGEAFPPAEDMPFERAVVLSLGSDSQRAMAATILKALQANGALRRLQAGGAVARTPRSSQEPRVTARGEALTPREMDILVQLDRGLSNKAIARALGISPKTVDHHVSAVIGKLDATSRLHAAALARQRGLLAGQH